MGTVHPQEQDIRSSSSEREKTPEEPTSIPTELSGKYEVISVIGKGAYGVVYKVKHKVTGTIYAAKHVENNAMNRHEVQIQASISDDRVVRVYDIVETTRDLLLIMEYCQGGNLLEWIKRNRRHDKINEKIVLYMLMEICEAVFNCHNKKIVHRDLKPENVLLDGRRRVKLGDFGVARILNRASVAKSFCGTPPYMAPELFLSYLSNPGGFGKSDVGYDNKCDVWSIGCILYDMANNKDRFVHHLQTSLGFDVAKSSSDTLSERDISELIDTDIPKEYTTVIRLLKRMLIKSPQDRIALLDILQDTEINQLLLNPPNSHWSDFIS